MNRTLKTLYEYINQNKKKTLKLKFAHVDVNGVGVSKSWDNILGITVEESSGSLVTFTENAKRKTVTPMDVVTALKRQGRTQS